MQEKQNLIFLECWAFLVVRWGLPENRSIYLFNSYVLIARYLIALSRLGHLKLYYFSVMGMDWCEVGDGICLRAPGWSGWRDTASVIQEPPFLASEKRSCFWHLLLLGVDSSFACSAFVCSGQDFTSECRKSYLQKHFLKPAILPRCSRFTNK